MRSELWLWMAILPFCFSAASSASPSTCPWNDSSSHPLFGRHTLSPEGAYRTWNISQKASFKLQRGMELSSSLVTHVCWSVPFLPVGKSMWDVKFIIGRWVGKIRFKTREIRWGDWVWQATKFDALIFAFGILLLQTLAGWILGPEYRLSQKKLLLWLIYSQFLRVFKVRCSVNIKILKEYVEVREDKFSKYPLIHLLDQKQNIAKNV